MNWRPLILSFLFFSLSLLYGRSLAFAEVVNFRTPDLKEGPREGFCYPTSLNETIAIKVNGSTGSGCEFSVDVTGGGEWVRTGRYFDSPPYAWGADTYYPDSISSTSDEQNRNRKFSFTCAQPAYTLDISKLPSYISLIKEEDIAGTGTTIPTGKRYHFSVNESAQTGGSFTAMFGYETTCDMLMDSDDWDGKTVPVGQGSGSCGRIAPITINPRKKSSSYPITIGESCLQHLLPSPTPKPPACNESCTSDNNQCPRECPLCQTNSRGRTTCQPPPPTPTLTPRPPACSEECVNANECPQDCPVCAIGDGGKNVCQPAQCNGPCASNSQCPQDCPLCQTNVNGGNTCQPPPPTPTLTPRPPICGGPCQPSGNQCPVDCPLCETDGGGATVCQPNPTSTPIPTATPTPPPVCGGPCVSSDNKCPIDCPVCRVSPNSNGQTICRPAASCDCDGFEYSGTIDRGQTVNFTGFAKVPDPDTNDAEVLNMVFHVEKNGVEVANSGEVAATSPNRTTDTAGNPIDRYSSQWSYTIPTDGSGEVAYRTYVKITCGYKSAAETQSARRLARGPQSVLAAETENIGIWGRILAFFYSLVGTSETPPVPPAPPTPTPIVTLAPGSVDTSFGIRSLKLGTIDPNAITPTPRVELACKEVRYWIQY